MEGRKLSNFIGIAIQREIEAYEFYRALGRKVDDISTKETLDLLANEEKRHREFLEAYQAGKLGPEALRLSDVVDYKIAEHLEKPDLQKNLESKDVYLVAAHRELNSYNFYAGLAAIHPQGEIKEMLTKMASEEKRHKEKVEYLYTNTAYPQTSGG
jgi:rubrerythrin